MAMRHNMAGLVGIVLFLGLPIVSIGSTYQVDDSAVCPGSGLEHAPFCSIDSCNQILQPGDVCEVADGNYVGAIQPVQAGLATARIEYRCSSGSCVVEPQTVWLVDLGQKSYVTIDGFDFQGDGALLRVAGSGSSGNVLSNFRSEGAYLLTQGGQDTVIRDFEFRLDSTTGIPFKLALNAAAEQGTSLLNGSIHGGMYNLTIGNCNDCTIDAVRFSGSWNRSIEIDGAENLTIKNSRITAAGADGSVSPYIKKANNLTIVNNAIVRGWSLPTPGHACDLTGIVIVRNNIFNNGGRRVDSSSAELNDEGTCAPAPGWPASFLVDHNAYVGADNFKNDIMTIGPDAAAFWQDKRNTQSMVDYFADSNPDLDDWGGDTGCDMNSMILDNLDYRSPSSASASPSTLWGMSAPFWAAPVLCGVSSSSFDTNRRWKDAIEVGDRLEFAEDGVLRQVTSIGLGGGDAFDGCQYRINFSPALPATPAVGDWFLAYPATGQGLPGKTYQLQPDSLVIDAGDDGSCGHPIVGAHCDMGPVEFASASPPPASIQPTGNKVTWTWNAIPGVTRYHVYRGSISGFVDPDQDGWPEGGFGSCHDSVLPDPTDPTIVDSSLPPAWDGWFYLVSSEAAQVESGVGQASNGIIRSVSVTCP